MTVVPQRITLHKQSNTLELGYGDQTYHLGSEFLRVHSPSAEVKGHGPGQEVLQDGKRNVTITQLATAGNYALKVSFDDGHNSGIYTWDYLHHLCCHKEALWEKYLAALAKANKSRDPNVQVVTLIDPKAH